SRREPSGARDRFGEGADHEPESRVRSGRGDAAVERARDASLAVRRHAAGDRARGRAGVLIPGASGGEPGAARPAAAVPAVHRDDEGLPAPDRRRGGAMIGPGAARAPAAAGATLAADVVAAGIIHERSDVGGGGRHACLGVFGTAVNPSLEAARAPSVARTLPKTPKHA